MTHRRPRLFLVDGSSYIFRAFFALPPVINSAGFPTNAIYGFTNLMLKFLKQHRPDYLAVVLDAGRKTFRNEMFTDYKGNRLEPPTDLVPQFPYIRRALEALNVPLFELPGYEADDLIGTLCETLCGEDCELVVVSSDKDLMQLVTENIKLFDSAKSRWIGAAEVIARFGVEPHRVAEVIGLMGDAVDNIPGVKGIGEKTAIALMQRFHSLEHLFDHLDELETTPLRGAARLRKYLEEGKEAAFLSRALATIKKDVPIGCQLEQLRCRGPNRDKLRALFVELEFTNLIKLLDHGIEITTDPGLVPQRLIVGKSLSAQLSLFSWK